MEVRHLGNIDDLANKVLLALKGELEDIIDLINVLQSKEWEIILYDNLYYLTSDKLNNLIEKKAINDIVVPYLTRLNGAASLVDRHHKFVNLAGLIRFDSNGLRHITINTGPIEFRIPDLKSKFYITNNTSGKTVVESWMKIAEEDKNVSDVLILIKEVNWINLYKIYEIIYEEISDEKIFLSRLNINKKSLNRFTYTFNNRNALGEMARHATKNNPAPKNPMSMDEAHAFIRTMFERWIDSKRSI